MILWIRRTALDLLRPFLKWAPNVHLPFTHKKVKGSMYYQVRPLLKPGTIFVTKIEGDLTSLIIPGYWSHAAIYSPEASQTVSEIVSEAEGPGVLATDLVSFLLTKDYFLALEPNGLGDKKEAIMARAAEIAAEQKGKPYDFNFNLHYQASEGLLRNHFILKGVTPNNPIGPTAFYCSKLVWWSYDQACQEFKVKSPFVPRMSLGVKTVTPDDIGKDRMHFSVLFSSKSV